MTDQAPAALPEDALPEKVRAMIGQRLYEEQTTFPIEMGYVYNTLAATQNGNPLFWDAAVAQEIAGGPVTPPSMMSVWFRPHYWSPGAEGEQKALLTHFDLKELLDLPEAVVTGSETVFHEPIRLGDVLHTCQAVRSISEPKNTKVGRGRFWVIDVKTENQRGELVGIETYTFLGYKRPEQ